MWEFLTAALSTIHSVAGPYAFGAYALTIAAAVITVWTAWRGARFKNLLESLQKLPPKDRMSVLETEMGGVRLAAGISPEQWVRSRIHRYFLFAFFATCVVIVTIATLAVVSRSSGPLFVGSITIIERQYQQLNNGQSLSGDVKQAIQEALELVAKGQLERAKDAYLRLPNDARVPAVLNDLGVVQEKLNDQKSALAAYQEALKKKSDYEPANANIARLNDPIKKPPFVEKSEPAIPGLYFSDSFAGSTLARDWTMKNQDPKKWKMQPTQKSLLIIAQTGSASDSKNLKNWLILNKDLPPGDFELIVEASIQIQGVGNSVSVALFEDDQNYLWIGLSGDEWGNNINRRPHFGRVSGGKSTFDREAENRFGTAGQPERIFFKIDRMGDQYNGFYAYVEKSIDIDQIAWKKLGTVPWIDFNGKLVLYAVNLRDKAPEVAAEFHSVRIRTQ